MKLVGVAIHKLSHRKSFSIFFVNVKDLSQNTVKLGVLKRISGRKEKKQPKRGEKPVIT